jgi:hypothetical protein
VRRHSLLLLLAVGMLLVTPGAAGAPLVPGDPTPPVVTPIITGTLGLNGWYVTNVTVNWLVQDPESVILETIGCDARSFTTDTLGTQLSCYARSDGGEVTVSITIRRDATGPVVTATPSRSPDANGWYNHALTVGFAGTDATSGIDFCVGPQTYSGPDRQNASVSGSCRDRAGNTTVRAFGFSYDATAPQVTGASASRPPDSNGWYNHALTVTFAGADATSGIDSCTQATYSGPDNQNASVLGTCRDRAGNLSSSSAFGLSYDATAPVVTGASPSRTPDSNGWYNHSLTVTFAGIDATSGIGSCTQTTYSGPDSANASVSGTCRDRAGNLSSSSAFGFSYDATGPVVTATPSRSPDSNGWYNHALSVSFAGTDPISGIDSCVGPQNYSGPDGAGRTVNGSCRDRAGNTTPRTFTLNYDATGPVVTATPSRSPDSNGWYNHGLSVSFAGTDVTSGIDSCVGPQSYAGPDGAGRTVNGSCRDRAGNTTPRAFTLDYDATAPQVTTATASRAPDSNGWYNHALTVTFAGADATSGIETCTQAGYSGPDSATASVSGTCRDRAGNQSPTSAFTFRYDATGPVVTATPSRSPDSNGWYNHALSVSFAGTDATSGLESCVPAQSYSGPDGAGRTVAGSCRDVAGNTTARTFTLNYDATGPVVTATPSRNPDSNGWYNHALSVGFAGTDATSGVESCTAPQSYSGPDSQNASVTGSCRDRAGNTTGRAFGFSYDATGPVVTPTPSRSPDANGWYNHALSVSYAGTDATSGLESCVAPQTYSGPDSQNASVTGSCRDRAGNTTLRAFGFSYDATGPVVTATPSRSPDANGWYNHALTVTFVGTDATSGVDSCVPPQSYSGPDGAGRTVNGSCQDEAGNTTARTFTLDYDGTGPVVTATPSRTPDSNGWYNHALTVSFAGTDATSGLESCVAPQSYSGPDNPNASVSGSCRDRAANTTVRVFGLSYDATAPQVTGASASRPPDSNGWYNHALSVTFAGTDATSGIEACTQATYSGPDSENASVPGSCLDRAGNQSTTSSFALSYDGTAPLVTDATAARPPDRGAWYNHAVVFAFEGTDETSGIDSCPSTLYEGPDGAQASVEGACWDIAGNRGASSFPLSYDETSPQVSPTPGRPADANGWYRLPLGVAFAGTDATSGVESCTTPLTYHGPDTTSASLVGSCLDRAGNTGTASFAFGYDATAPQVTGAVPSREPDANGWYDHALTIRFGGSDATSGLDACTETVYAGPDDPAASVGGSCVDRAGNRSGSTAFSLRYDATDPTVAMLTVKPGRRSAELRWQTSSDTNLVELTRSPGRTGAARSVVYRGEATVLLDRGLVPGRTYRYTLNAYDEAQNRGQRSLDFVGRGALISPAPGARVERPPLLGWAPVPRARYYNVLLVYRGKRVFAAWPLRPQLQLGRSWTYRGRRYRLRPGRYRWYVFPGYGSLRAGNFGRLLGGSTFVVSG